MHAIVIAIFTILAATTAAGADERSPRQSLCLMLESAATAHGLPLPFLARVIWRESRFDPQAVGPMTRSGARAKGIAQFMPGTAAERDLADPFDAVAALPKAAEYLGSLRDDFGNLGLAAAAYNAGPARVRGWLAGTRTLPDETRAYVRAVTGRAADDWAKAGSVAPEAAPQQQDCPALIASLGHEPGRFFDALERRVAGTMGKPWGVELTAGFSRSQVLAIYGKLMKRLSDVIGTQDPIIVSQVFRNRGTRPFYEARIGADTRQAADALCKRIRDAGAACIVTRNRG